MYSVISMLFCVNAFHSALYCIVLLWWYILCYKCVILCYLLHIYYVVKVLHIVL